MKDLLKKIKINRKNSEPLRVETVAYQNKLYEQTLLWKANISASTIMGQV